MADEIRLMSIDNRSLATDVRSLTYLRKDISDDNAKNYQKMINELKELLVPKQQEKGPGEENK